MSVGGLGKTSLFVCLFVWGGAGKECKCRMAEQDALKRGGGGRGGEPVGEDSLDRASWGETRAGGAWGWYSSLL